MRERERERERESTREGMSELAQIKKEYAHLCVCV